MIGQKIVVSARYDRFKSSCDTLLEKGYTIIPTSIRVSSGQAGTGWMLVAFFDPPADIMCEEMLFALEMLVEAADAEDDHLTGEVVNAARAVMEKVKEQR